MVGCHLLCKSCVLVAVKISVESIHCCQQSFRSTVMHSTLNLSSNNLVYFNLICFQQLHSCTCLYTLLCPSLDITPNVLLYPMGITSFRIWFPPLKVSFVLRQVFYPSFPICILSCPVCVLNSVIQVAECVSSSPLLVSPRIVRLRCQG